MRVVVQRGRVERQRASALITSANDALVGNLQPEYWRFVGRDNVDSAIRATGGPDLEAACLNLPPRSDEVRRDCFRWEAAVKRGPSAVVRCPTGTAVATPAFGRLEADVVVHAVAPDVELAKGTYRGRSSYRVGACDHDRLPEELLRDAYASAFVSAADAGADTVVCPALGAGVKGWNNAVTAAFGLDAAASMATSMATEQATLDEVAFVVGECDVVFGTWIRVATALLGPPGGTSGDGHLVWHIEPGAAADDTGDVLPLVKVDEMKLPRTRWATAAFIGPGYITAKMQKKMRRRLLRLKF